MTFTVTFKSQSQHIMFTISIYVSVNTFTLESYDISSETTDVIIAPVNDCHSQTNHYYFGDIDGDNHTDLICHDFVTGVIKICTSLHPLKTCIFSEYSPFCYNEATYRKTLSVGQFQSSKKHDIFLCLNHNTGNYVLRDLLDWNNNVSHELNKAFCVNDKFILGDFHNDGIPDLSCHVHHSFPPIYVLPSNGDGSFNAETFHPLKTSWCYHSYKDLFMMGDFNGDGKVDLFCLDIMSGRMWALLAESDGSYISWNVWQDANAGFCKWVNKNDIELKTGDVNGDGKDDVICHNMLTGEINITYASTGK